MCGGGGGGGAENKLQTIKANVHTYHYWLTVRVMYDSYILYCRCVFILSEVLLFP